MTKAQAREFMESVRRYPMRIVDQRTMDGFRPDSAKFVALDYGSACARCLQWVVGTGKTAREAKRALAVNLRRFKVEHRSHKAGD